MHKSKGSKHNLVLDRQKAKEFLEKRKQLRDRRTAPNNVREENNGTLVHSTGRKMEDGNV